MESVQHYCHQDNKTTMKYHYTTSRILKLFKDGQNQELIRL